MGAVINNLFRIVLRKFRSVKYYGLALLFFLTSDWALKAQPCNIIPNAQKICVGSTITFSRSPLSASDSAYLWSFGDNSTSNQSIPTYQYPQAGNYTVNLRVYKFGGTFCDAPPIIIRVFTKPIANYAITPNDTQCFNQNRFVFNDLSISGASNAPIKRRTMIYGDGAFVTNNAPFNNQLSHSYTDANGNNYLVVLEVEDTNGCVAQLVDTVVVYPKIIADMTFVQDMRCGQTVVGFRNSSLVDTIGLQSTWIFGDGQIQTRFNDTAYKNFFYTYYGDTIFYPQLIINDKNGCKDTTDKINFVRTFIPDSIIHIKPTNKQCYNSNEFVFENKTKVEDRLAFSWSIIKPDDYYQIDSSGKEITYIKLLSCGVYNIILRFNYYSCSFLADTTVTVYGPRAIIEDTTNEAQRNIQCSSADTVRLAFKDGNCYYANSNLTYLWDFDDGFAPSCTTNTKLGINVNQNCRYSTDSVMVKHHYLFPNQSCYKVSLIVRDSVIGCVDTIYKYLRLALPKAGWDSTVLPPRPRVDILFNKCTLDKYEVNFPRIEPLCGPQNVWLMKDTSCPFALWNKIAEYPLGLSRQDIQLTDICSKDTIAVLGIIVKNGECYDTGYYSYPVNKVYQSVLMKKEFDTDICAPHQVTFYTVDSIRKDLLSFTYEFGDGSPPNTYIFNGVGDTVVKSINYVYAKNGAYNAKFKFLTKDSCIKEDLISFVVGNIASLSILTPEICVNSLAKFNAKIRYVNSPIIDFWNDTLRRNANMERIYWNFGDSDIWYLGAEAINHKYTKVGVYYIKMAYKDSSLVACFDTVQGFKYRVSVNGIRALAKLSSDTFYCAPTVVTFIDESYGMQGDSIPKPSLIVGRFWEFDAGKGTSILKQPGVFYNQNGKYSAKLYSNSVDGCYDTTLVSLNIVGPTPSFVIVEDTFGCIPFTVKLRNQTGQALNNFIWYFNNQAGAIYSTKSDTDITFTYTQPGTFKIDLLGEDSITNATTNETKNCTARFPFLDNANAFHPRTITALPIDTLKLTVPDTVCIEVPFIAKAFGTQHNIQANWFWGINNVPVQWPVNTDYTYTYDSAGKYNLVVDPIITQKNQCVVGTEKEITVLSPLADFTFKLNNYPNIPFTNLSQGAVRYDWNFGQPSSGQNTSNSINPTHNYGETKESYTVCLMAFDAKDCMDSICKIIPIRSSVKIPNVFTPDNADGRNDAFDIDIDGWEKYELFIYNRWGTMVFEGFKDGFLNDGINWDGKDKNDGSKCPEGTYFVVFKYKLITEPEEQTYHGTITLIRD